MFCHPTKGPRVRLTELRVGDRARVVRVERGTVGEGRRLQEVGFVPGTIVSVERRAPLGDPTVYEIRSTRLALRRRAADLVEVEALGTGVEERR